MIQSSNTIKISNLSDEIVFTLPPNSANLVSKAQLQQIAAGTLPLEMAQCSFFDPATRSISTEGCRLISVKTDGTLECACTHMTDFMGFLKSGLSVLAEANFDVILALGQLSASSISSNIGFYFSIGFVALLLLLVLLCRLFDRYQIKDDYFKHLYH